MEGVLGPPTATSVSMGLSLLPFFTPHNISQKLVGTHHRSFLMLGRGRQTATHAMPQHTALVSMCNQPCRIGPSRPFLRNVKMGNLVTGGAKS